MKLIKDSALIGTLMKARGLTSRDVAAEMGWGSSHSYVNRIRSGQVKTISDDTARELARVLKVAPSLLFMSKPSSESGRNTRRSVA